MKILWMVLLTLTFSCSLFQTKEPKTEPSEQIVLSDTEEFGDDPASETTNDLTTESEPMGNAVTSEDNSVLSATEETTIENDYSPTVSEEVASTGSIETYKVKKNETLMMVAFSIYGDYDRWREIASMNQDTLKGSNQIREGMSLKYEAPSQPFVWSPEGNPYLIKNGDTLGSISNEVYQTKKYWKKIWENNKPLIKNPNRIFAGFTIFYQELDKVAGF